MRRSRLFAGIFLVPALLVPSLLVGSLAMAGQTTPAVWQGLEWGMTKQDVVAHLPGARDYTLSLGHRKEAHLFGVPSYQVSGCLAKIVLQFKDKRLSNINLDFQFGDPKYGKCDAVVAHGLRAAYGKPVSFEAVDSHLFHIERGKWLSPTADIYYHSISEIKLRHDMLPLELSVTYMPRMTIADQRL